MSNSIKTSQDENPPGRIASLAAMAPHAAGDEAARFMEAWYGPDTDDRLVQINRLLTGGAPHPRALTLSKSTAVDMLSGADLDDLVYSEEKTWNLYHSCGFLKEVPPDRKRGGKSYISQVPGVFLDLDVKAESFSSEEQILAFLRTFPILPAILVSTGTGGIHAYWKCSSLVDAEQAERLGEMWWAFAQSRAPEGVKIDKVFNRDRILRLPGSVRWPKATEAPSLARIRYLDPTVVTTPDEIRAASQAAWKVVEERRRHTRHSIARASLSARDIEGLADNPWMQLYVSSQLPDHFNEHHSWVEILEPKGWSRIGTDYTGRAIWARPGGTGQKSATTDYPGSPNVMNLFSTSPETGLADLLDAGIPLTKYRVYVQLYWAGDEAAFVSEYLKTLPIGN